MVRNNHSQKRRNVIRSIAGIGGFSVVSLGSSRARATQPEEKNKYYQLAYNSDLVYVGPETDGNNYLANAVDGLNEAEDRNEIRFKEVDNQVNIVSVDTPASPSSDSAITTTQSCDGKNDYKSKLHWQGLRHIFWFDDCTSTEIRNKLIGGMAVSEVAAVIANAAPGVGQGAAVATACAGIFMGAGATLITANNEGSGIKLWFHGPNIADIDVYEIRAQ